MRVYRLEKRGIGPFVNREARWLIKNAKKQKRASHASYQHKPTNRWLQKHTQAIYDGEYLFGARTKESLKAYFGYNLKHYFKQGYRIKTYEVPRYDVIDMGGEVAFHVKHHKLRTVKKIEKHLTSV